MVWCYITTSNFLFTNNQKYFKNSDYIIVMYLWEYIIAAITVCLISIIILVAVYRIWTSLKQNPSL